MLFLLLILYVIDSKNHLGILIPSRLSPCLPESILLLFLICLIVCRPHIAEISRIYFAHIWSRRTDYKISFRRQQRVVVALIPYAFSVLIEATTKNLCVPAATSSLANRAHRQILHSVAKTRKTLFAFFFFRLDIEQLSKEEK